MKFYTQSIRIAEWLFNQLKDQLEGVVSTLDSKTDHLKLDKKRLTGESIALLGSAIMGCGLAYLSKDHAKEILKDLEVATLKHADDMRNNKDKKTLQEKFDEWVDNRKSG